MLKRIAIFGGSDDAPRRIAVVARDLPAYADRSFRTGGGCAEFLDALPFLDRAGLRGHFPQGFLRSGERFADVVGGGAVELVRTSGTSAERLQLLWEAGWWERQEEAALRTNPAIAPHLGESYTEAVLTTPLCSESVCKVGPSTLEERCIDNLLFLNTRDDPTRWTGAEAHRMATEIATFGPTAMEADPVYLASFLRICRKRAFPIAPPKWVTLTYEFVSAIDRGFIRSQLDCPLFDFYGLTEAGVFFLECPAGRHHFCGTDAIVEILREDSSALEEDVGEIVVTTWGNPRTPLLRYRTGDLARVTEEPCSCGMSGLTIATFEGRTRDVIAAPGRALTPRDIDTALNGVVGLAQYCCRQTAADAMRAEFVAENGSEPGSEIRERLAAVAPSMRIEARRVSFIPPEPSGKYRTVVPL